MGVIRFPDIRNLFREAAKNVLEYHIIPLFLGKPPFWAHRGRYEITDGTGAKVTAFLLVIFQDPDDGKIKVLFQEKKDGKLAGSGGGHYERSLKEQPIQTAGREFREEICDDNGHAIVPDIMKYIEDRALIVGTEYPSHPFPPVDYTGFVAWLTDEKSIRAIKTHTHRIASDLIYRKRSLEHAKHEITGLRIMELSEAIDLARQEDNEVFLHPQEKTAFLLLEKYFSPNFAVPLQLKRETLAVLEAA